MTEHLGGNPVASDDRPWGTWEVLLDEPYCKVKRIRVKSGHRTSYQKHNHREEIWTVVQGTATVTLNGNMIKVNVGETLNVGQSLPHRIGNEGPEELVFIEIQRGTYFGEDDIIRIQDDYGRL